MLSKHGFFTTQARSELMRKIRSKDTKTEIIFRKSFWRMGYRYRKNYDKLPGKPDIVFIRQKVVVFIDGEFWHGYQWVEIPQLVIAFAYVVVATPEWGQKHWQNGNYI